MPDIGLAGGDALTRRLREIADHVSEPATLKVGFLADATYPDGTSVAYIAAIQEFGATINREPGQVTVFRKLDASGTGYLRGGRFVKRRESNFSTTHATPAYQIRIPPRPFFRNMIAKNSAAWPDQIAKLLKASSYAVIATLEKMGKRIEGQLVTSIKDLTDPPNAPSTIRKKGAAKPLIDTGVMWNSVDSEVTTGTP